MELVLVAAASLVHPSAASALRSLQMSCSFLTFQLVKKCSELYLRQVISFSDEPRQLVFLHLKPLSAWKMSYEFMDIHEFQVFLRFLI